MLSSFQNSCEDSEIDESPLTTDDVIFFTDGFIVSIICTLQVSCGLRIQDLQEAKDLLLVETADMLQIPLFTAEALLRNYGKFAFVKIHINRIRLILEWSKEYLLQSWIEDPIRCCEISGVNPPLSLLHERGLTTIDINDFDTVHLSNEVRASPEHLYLFEEKF